MFNRTHSPAALVLVASLLASSGALALYEDDTRISTDAGAVSRDVETAAFSEIQGLLRQGYPVQSVYLHGVSKGLSIDDLVFLSVRADPASAARFADAAIDMLPVLPVWACRDDSDDAAKRFAPVVGAGGGDAVVSIQTIAQRFFDDNVRVGPFPDWTGDEIHVQVPTVELAQLIRDGFWYRNDRADRPVNRGIMVSFYQHDRSIVVDGNPGRVRQALEQGESSVPVVLLYNEERQRPVSDFGENPSVGDIAAAFFDERLRLTHVPDWRDPYGDYHDVAEIAEFEEFLTLPSREEIDDARWSKLITELRAEGFERKPVIVSMYFEGNRVWVDEPDRLTAARELGMEQAPVVYLYHGIDRLPCGVAPGGDCEERIRTAAELATL